MNRSEAEATREARHLRASLRARDDEAFKRYAFVPNPFTIPEFVRVKFGEVYDDKDNRADRTRSQEITLEWLRAHPEILAQHALHRVPSFHYCCALDLRAPHSLTISDYLAQTTLEPGTLWGVPIEYEAVGVRVKFATRILETWGFPEDYIANQIEELKTKSAAGGPLASVLRAAAAGACLK